MACSLIDGKADRDELPGPTLPAERIGSDYNPDERFCRKACRPRIKFLCRPKGSGREGERFWGVGHQRCAGRRRIGRSYEPIAHPLSRLDGYAQFGGAHVLIARQLRQHAGPERYYASGASFRVDHSCSDDRRPAIQESDLRHRLSYQREGIALQYSKVFLDFFSFLAYHDSSEELPSLKIRMHDR